MTKLRKAPRARGAEGREAQVHPVSELSKPRVVAPLLIAALLWIGGDSLPAPMTATEVLDRHSPEIVRELNANNLVLLPADEDGSLYINALVVFDQPLRRALDLLSQTERQPDYLPELKHMETVRRDGTAVIDDHHLRILFVPIDYRLRTETDFDAARIWWKLDPSRDNDLQVLEGYWQFYELDASRSLGEFGTRVVLGSALPGFLQDAA